MSLREEHVRLLDGLADGRLEGAERAEAERLVRENPDAAAYIRASAEADAAVRRLFAPPGEIPLTTAPVGTIAPAGRRVWVRWVMAAALLLAALGAYISNFVLVESPDSVYRELVASGFEPSWECKNDEEFANYTHHQLGEAYLVAPAEGVKLLGWNYNSAAGILSEQATTLLVDSGGAHVVVFSDRVSRDRPLRLRPFSRLHLFRREMGSVVLYEVSPLDHESVIPLAHVVPAPVTEEPSSKESPSEQPGPAPPNPK